MIIFPEGALEKHNPYENKHGLPEVNVVNTAHEGETAKEVVDILMKRYGKVVKFLFASYSHSGFSSKSRDIFDTADKKVATISTAELWKMLTDYHMTQYLTKEELQMLIRAVNLDILGKVESRDLNMTGFGHLLVQFAIFAFSRNPKNMAHLPVYNLIEELFRCLRAGAAKLGVTTIMYDDPDGTEMGDKELNIYLNE